MKVYVEAKSKAALIRRLAAGEEIIGYNYSMFGGGGHYALDDTLEDGTIIAIYSQMSQGNPVAKSWATWTNGVLKAETFEADTEECPNCLDGKMEETIDYQCFDCGWTYTAESFDAENWGGDPEGPLAKALDKARSADPTPPLVIESFGPDTDMKYLIEVAKTCSPVVTVDDWDVFVDELREQAMDHIVTMTARYVDESFTQSIGEPVEVYYGDDPSEEGGVAAHDPDTGKVVEEINESRYFAYMDDAEGEIIQAAYREAHGKLPWDKDAESFALEHRDIDPREHHRRQCPNCHGNLYAEGCVHHGIMPRMRHAESFKAPGDQPCYICEKDQWTHQGEETTYAVCDSCKASFVCRQCGSSKVDPPGRLSSTSGYAYPTAQCHDCGAVWNPHKEGVSATRLHSREESDSLFGKKLGGMMTRVTMGQRRRLDPRSGVEVPNEPSHYCSCGNPLFIYPVWDLPESHRLGRESLKAECEKCGWKGVVQRHDTSQGDPPRSFNAPGGKTFPHLFKKATTGKIQEWRIRTEELPGGNWAYISSHGQLGGSMVEGKGVVIKAGKQGRTIEEQANAEAASKWKKKRDTGYFETPDEAENNLVLLPMLALDHKKRGHNIEWPAIGQPKLDGVRCMARLDSDGNISLTSRKNKPFPGMDHIRDELAARLQDLGKSVGDPFPNDIVIDGELYADPDELTFQQVTGLVRRNNKKPEDIENEKKLKLNVYDSINVNDLDMDFIDRHELVSNNLRGMDSVTIVENTPLADPDAVDPIHDQFVREGYEGLIIRNLKGPYKLNGRSKHLQKYKSFQDGEYEIVGYEEGKGNYQGTVIWVCETPEGKTFKIKPNGTHEQRSTWFDNADDYIGQRITVRFFELTDDGIPRFPTGGWFRNYEAEEWELDQCAFCDTLIYDDEDSTEFEDEHYHDLCLSHWLHMDAETESFAAGPAKRSTKMKGFVKRLKKFKDELDSRMKSVENKIASDIEKYGTPLGNKQGERRVKASKKKIANLEKQISNLKIKEAMKKPGVGLTGPEKSQLDQVRRNPEVTGSEGRWDNRFHGSARSRRDAKQVHRNDAEDTSWENFGYRSSATTKGIDNLTIPFDELAEEEEAESNNRAILIGVLCGSALMAFISSKLK